MNKDRFTFKMKMVLDINSLPKCFSYSKGCHYKVFKFVCIHHLLVNGISHYFSWQNAGQNNSIKLFRAILGGNSISIYFYNLATIANFLNGFNQLFDKITSPFLKGHDLLTFCQPFQCLQIQVFQSIHGGNIMMISIAKSTNVWGEQIHEFFNVMLL